MMQPPLSYILPIRKARAEADADLDSYIRWLDSRVELIVVDASPPDVFDANEQRWAGVTHLRPDPALVTPNGKVWGVNSGLRQVSHVRLIVGDDDVRYEAAALERMAELLGQFDIVRPQNYFDPAPWHAIWDSGRSLLARISGGDWPGTLGVRADLLRGAGGYNGDCLFENLEMVRTVLALGGRECNALDLFVIRRPPATAHFWSQRVRQAYDEFARPVRLAFQLAWLPLQALALARRRNLLPSLYFAVVVLAEAGRRRGNGQSVFPFAASLLAPCWVIERSFCSWAALFSRLGRGGAVYRGGVIKNAATPLSELRRRQEEKCVAA